MAQTCCSSNWSRYLCSTFQICSGKQHCWFALQLPIMKMLMTQLIHPLNRKILSCHKIRVIHFLIWCKHQVQVSFYLCYSGSSKCWCTRIGSTNNALFLEDPIRTLPKGKDVWVTVILECTSCVWNSINKVSRGTFRLLKSLSNWRAKYVSQAVLNCITISLQAPRTSQ